MPGTPQKRKNARIVLGEKGGVFPAGLGDAAQNKASRAYLFLQGSRDEGDARGLKALKRKRMVRVPGEQKAREQPRGKRGLNGHECGKQVSVQNCHLCPCRKGQKGRSPPEDRAPSPITLLSLRSEGTAGS